MAGVFVPGWAVSVPKIQMPWVANAETVNSEPFNVARNTQTMTIHCPALIGGASLTLQTLDPQNADTASIATWTWRNVFVFNLSSGGVVQLTAIPSNQATTLPIAATGGGVFRFVASGSQAATPVFISITFTYV